MKINHKEITVLTTCPFCGRISEVEVNLEDYCDWQDGAFAVDAFPYLSAAKRDGLNFGICLECWDKGLWREVM